MALPSKTTRIGMRSQTFVKRWEAQKIRERPENKSIANEE